ncbi:hypothetical protein EVAR_12351_1 [Eumeta japonica]|uniref:Uncharacterized protein n=1 Tax=Eumeta variegata TaxID=151549 RepID=A0A4C1X148_EUMVA|nr:hypothetical protein EVAR_12351_1 [Eumeta japonica]
MTKATLEASAVARPVRCCVQQQKKKTNCTLWTSVHYGPFTGMDTPTAIENELNANADGYRSTWAGVRSEAVHHHLGPYFIRVIIQLSRRPKACSPRCSACRGGGGPGARDTTMRPASPAARPLFMGK